MLESDTHMEGLLVLLGLVVLAAPILSVISLINQSNARKEMRRLNAQISDLEKKIASLSVASEPNTGEATPSEEHTKPEAMTPAPSLSPPKAQQVRRRPAPRTTFSATWTKISQLSESLKAANWLILGGGAALALSLIFLVKYSVDQGFLGPIARVTIGALSGIGLVALSQFLRGRSIERLADIVREDVLPPTLAAAGLIALYASCFGAHALYDLLSGETTFALLAMISIAGVALSLVHGPYIAALGLAGAYLVPLIVTTDSASAMIFFAYLAFVTLTGLVLTRFRQWNWLSWLAFIGSTLWFLLWSVGPSNLSDDLVFAVLYVAAIAVAFPVLTGHRGLHLRGLKDLPPQDRAMSFVAILATLSYSFFAIALFAEYNTRTEPILGLIIVAGSYICFSWIRDEFENLLALSGILGIMILVTWDFPGTGFFVLASEHDKAAGWAPLFPAELTSFISATALVTFASVGSAFARVMAKDLRSGYWSTVGIATAVLAVAIAYMRINRFDNSISWAVVGLLLSAALVPLAFRIRQIHAARPDDPALAAFAIGILAFIGLAMTMALEEAWLSVSLSLLLPATAWVHQRLLVPQLKYTAWLIGLIVLVRLILNPAVASYDLDGYTVFNWMLYGYGVPSAAFFAASRLFMTSGRDRTFHLMEAGSLAFFILCVMAQIRLFIHDGEWLTSGYHLIEAALNTALWLGLSYGLFRRQGETPDPIMRAGAIALLCLSLFHILAVHLLTLNPLFDSGPVGTLPLLNVLAMAYLLPALLLCLFQLPWHRQRLETFFTKALCKVLPLVPFVMVFLWITLEIRRSFHGPVLNGSALPEAELYTYSLVWLIFAATLMVTGIWKNLHALRLGGLVVIGFTTLKMFLFDMSGLTGLYRVMSFFGLGISLLGIGYLARRFVVPPKPEYTSSEESGTST